MKKMLLILLTLLFTVYIDYESIAQTPQVLKGLNYNAFTYVPPPGNYTHRDILGKIQTSNFEIEYENVPQNARVQIEKALDIWGHLIYCPTCTIKVKAKWESLEEGELAHAAPKDLFGRLSRSYRDREQGFCYI